jgi:hypothetical protein
MPANLLASTAPVVALGQRSASGVHDRDEQREGNSGVFGFDFWCARQLPYGRLPRRTNSIAVMQVLSHTPPAAYPATTSLK